MDKVNNEKWKISRRIFPLLNSIWAVDSFSSLNSRRMRLARMMQPLLDPPTRYPTRFTGNPSLRASFDDEQTKWSLKNRRRVKKFWRAILANYLLEFKPKTFPRIPPVPFILVLLILSSVVCDEFQRIYRDVLVEKSIQHDRLVNGELISMSQLSPEK